MPEKTIGSPVDFQTATPLITAIPKNIVAGIYVYQPSAVLVPTAMYAAFVNGNMDILKLTIDTQTNTNLLYAKFSWNATPQDENYFNVTDLAIGAVFRTKEDITTTEYINALLSLSWFNDMWIACGMQNGYVQAYDLNISISDINWTMVAIGAGIITIAGLSIWYFFFRKPSNNR